MRTAGEKGVSPGTGEFYKLASQPQYTFFDMNLARFKARAAAGDTAAAEYLSYREGVETTATVAGAVGVGALAAPAVVPWLATKWTAFRVAVVLAGGGGAIAQKSEYLFNLGLSAIGCAEGEWRACAVGIVQSRIGRGTARGRVVATVVENEEALGTTAVKGGPTPRHGQARVIERPAEVLEVLEAAKVQHQAASPKIAAGLRERAASEPGVALAAGGGIRANAARGKAFEGQVAAEMESEGWSVAREVTLETPGGARTRMDIVGTRGSSHNTALVASRHIVMSTMSAAFLSILRGW